MSDTTTAAPEMIPADAYQGRWVQAAGKSRRPLWYAARDIARAPLNADGVLVAWVSFGHVRGREMFYRTRFLPLADGSLVTFGSDGRRGFTHAPGAALRILCQS